MNHPKTPSHFMQSRPPAPSFIPSKITLNFVLPHASQLSSREAELRPGILSVHEGNEVPKYFASIHANSIADVIAVEAVPIDDIDQSLVQKGLAGFTQKLASATTGLEKAEAQIGIDVHSAFNSALSG